MTPEELENFLSRLSSAGALGAGYAVSEDLASRQRKYGQQAMNQAQRLGQQLSGAASGAFKPFAVSTGLGPGLTVGQEGISMQMSDQMTKDAKALARSGAQQLLSATGAGKLQSEQERLQGMLLGQGIGQAQQDIYGQLQAMRQPQEERDRLALEERLFSQGRSGVRTAQYGGTPEQLAMEKAIQEQRAADALTARGQAVSERESTAGLISQALQQGRANQALQAELGLGGAQAAFLPQQQALSLLAGGVPFSELATRAGLQGVTAQGELLGAGLQGLLGGQASAAATQQQYLQNLLGGLFDKPEGEGEESFFRKALRDLFQ
jgi:hypothetical protein